jgi:hypothetical protein
LKILDIRPAPPGAGSTRARFDVEMPDGVRLFDLKLCQTRSGWRVYGPQHFGSAVVTFPPAVADQIITVAREAVANVEYAA